MPGADTARLVVDLSLSGNFSKESAKAVTQVKAMTTQTKSLTSQVKGSVLQGVGLGAGVTGFNLLAQGITGVISAAGDAVDAASDLAESQSKVNVVFAEGAKEVFAWGKTSATSMGLSEQAALEAAGTFGNFIQALGNSREEAQSMSTEIVGLAADLASFNNVNIDEVILALRSGLAGEAEPMRRLGVSISATRVEANILAKGIVKTKEEITDAMKVSERYAIIMEDTALAQGDFERTSDGLANQQRILDARMTNVSATMGRGLVPAMRLGVDVMGVFADTVMALTSAGGGDGSLDALISDLKLTANGFEGLKAPTKETGDLFEDLRNSAADLGLLPEFAKEREWRVALQGIQKEMGLTDDQVKILIDTSTQLGLSLDQTIDSLEGTGEAARDSAHELQAHRLATQEWARQNNEAYQESQKLARGINEESRPAFTLLGKAAVAVARNVMAAGRSAEVSGQFFRDIAADADIAKGSFKDFWQSIREQQRRQRYFLRHPEKFREETNQLQRQLDRAMDEYRRRTSDGVKKSEALWAEGQRRIIADLQARLGTFTALGKAAGTAYGNAAERTAENSFDPHFTLRNIASDIFARRTPKNVGQNWAGGVIPPGSFGTAGERGVERISNVGGMTVIEPMGGRMKPDAIAVNVRPVITAFMVGRELGRAATTRRSGAGVL